MTTYEYVHRAGYGSDDHMADEIIARAARHLGLDATSYIAASVGLLSHSVPMGLVTVRLHAAPGVRQRMERALASARREVRRRDCEIAVVCVRRSRRRDEWGLVEAVEERRGRHWCLVATMRRGAEDREEED